MMNARKTFSTRFLAAPGLMGISILFYYVCQKLHFIQDDAFITFRYVENFLDGHGLVWNIGERVEGYTNFLWLLLQIFADRIGLDYQWAISALAPLLSILTIFLCYRITVSELSRRNKYIIGLAAALLLAANYSFIYWTIAGLETPLFAFLTLAAFAAYHRRSWLLAPALTLAILTRPEGILLASFFPLFALINTRRLPVRELQVLALALAPLIPYAIFKLSYYGSLVPNPFYAKTVWDMEQLTSGLEYTWEFLKHYGMYGTLFVLPALMYRKLPETTRALYLFAVLYTVYIILIGGDVLKVGRFFLPVLAPLYISFALSLAALLNRSRYVLAILIPQLALQCYLPLQSALMWRSLEIGLYSENRDTITQLRTVDNSNFTIATSTIGLVGYLLKGHVVYDMVGLTDTVVARHPQEPIDRLYTTWRERKYNAEYILRQAPDYIFFSTGAKPSSPGERALFLYDAFLENYRTIGFYSYSHKRVNDVYKRMSESLGPIALNYDQRFVQEYNGGINAMREKRYMEALAHFQNARLWGPEGGYPYVFYQASRGLTMMNQHEQALGALFEALKIDTNLYSVHSALYISLYEDSLLRHIALQSRRHIQRLAPWELPRLDKLAGYRPDK
ncbi:MAG: hypothetical protein IH914_00700 [candidate division Zixibacteria bacterium]|nr:hypothetical protein [candidate division Zixibacteria bacterium]